jgi:hypothetical protein
MLKREQMVQTQYASIIKAPGHFRTHHAELSSPDCSRATSPADLRLSEEEISRLEEVSELPVEYPGWMPATQGADRLGAPLE